MKSTAYSVWKKAIEANAAKADSKCNSSKCEMGKKLKMSDCGTYTTVDLKGTRVDTTWKAEACHLKALCKKGQTIPGVSNLKHDVYCGAIQTTATAAAALAAIAYSM